MRSTTFFYTMLLAEIYNACALPLKYFDTVGWVGLVLVRRTCPVILLHVASKVPCVDFVEIV